MPGTYAHLAIVNQLTRRQGHLSAQVQNALDGYFRFCDLGAVSPDYPYLTFIGGKGEEWANAMHHENTMEMIREGIKRLSAMPEGEKKEKCIAWLFGYATHVIADCKIHPVVNEIAGGEYSKDTMEEHRRCEMHQDAYIFEDVMKVTVKAAEYLDSSLKHCSSTENRQELDEDVRNFWDALLKEVYPVLYREDTPRFDLWHQDFINTLDTIPELLEFLPLSRHLVAKDSVTYPSQENLNKDKYINNLATPRNRMNYHEIFDETVEEILKRWLEMDRALNRDEETCFEEMGEPSLDTGLNKSKIMVFWP